MLDLQDLWRATMIGRWREAFVFALLLAGGTTSLAASDQPWQRLLRDDSPSGWDHAAEGTHGWHLENGVLRGSHGAAPLLGGWTVGDFELRFTWSVEPA